MSRAAESRLSQLHNLLAEKIIGELTEERFVLDKDGKAWPAPVPPALLAQAIKFLKDNGIDAPARSGSKLDDLRKELEGIPEMPLYPN